MYYFGENPQRLVQSLFFNGFLDVNEFNMISRKVKEK